MGGVLALDPADYVAASVTVGARVAPAVRSAGDGLVGVLSGCGAMAGSDPVGVSWANGYDAAVAAVLAATQDAVTGAYRLAGLLEQTGFNYSTAEDDSRTGGGGPPPVDTTGYGDQPVRLDGVPAASGGGDPVLPTAWSQVQDHVGRVWPNGHQDRLRQAAAGWHAGACLLYDASDQLADAVASIALAASPESDTAIGVCTGLRDTLQQLADTYNTLSTACGQYAEHLDQAHRQARAELRSLLEWTAGIEIAGATIAILTLGASEVVSQGTVIARTILTATRITAIIDRLATLTTDLLETLTTVIDRAAAITGDLNPLTTARRVAAITDTVEAIRTGKTALDVAEAELEVGAQIRRSPFAAPLRQVESHYKHAAAFGVVRPRCSAGFKEFATALSDFVHDDATAHVLGTYRAYPALLSYNAETRLVVVQHLDGSFWSAWKMTPKQLMHVLTERSLGGG